MQVTKNVLTCSGPYKLKKEENSQHVCQVNTNVIKLDVIIAKKGGKIKDILLVGAKKGFEFSKKRDIRLRVIAKN